MSMKNLQKVLKYSRTFEEEYDVRFSVARIRGIFDEMKAVK